MVCPRTVAVMDLGPCVGAKQSVRAGFCSIPKVGGQGVLKPLSFQSAISMDLAWWTQKPLSRRRRSGPQCPPSTCVSPPQTRDPGEAQLRHHVAFQECQCGPDCAVRYCGRRCSHSRSCAHQRTHMDGGDVCV